MTSPLLIRVLSVTAALAIPSGLGAAEKLYAGPPLKVLVITGGCYHNYEAQTHSFTNAVGAMADIAWTVMREECTGSTRKELELYNDPDWAKPYDVVVHNECFADTTDPAYIRKITAAHKAGKPSVVVHCAMHTYRAAMVDDWREFLGVTSLRHEHQSRYPVKVLKPEHPVMKGFPPDWVTPMDEIYVIEKVWPNTMPLASSKSERDGREHAAFWVNEYFGTRVVGTTYGHSDETFRDPVFLGFLGRGILWAAGKLK